MGRASGVQGERIEIRAGGRGDAYLASLSVLLPERDSPEDAGAMTGCDRWNVVAALYAFTDAPAQAATGARSSGRAPTRCAHLIGGRVDGVHLA